MIEPPSTILVIPCYNEAKRLRIDHFQKFRRKHSEVSFLFVDDGSTDRTGDLLGDLNQEDPLGAQVVVLPQNRGKAEAVRQGMLAALDRSPAFAGYWDADLATPLEELPRFVHMLVSQEEVQLVCGARIPMPGHDIERRRHRQYLGRALATIASVVLPIHVRDSQAGAKLFRATSEVRALFVEPFISRWLFDLELLARFERTRTTNGGSPAGRAIRELPLTSWRDVPGSNLRPNDVTRGVVELFQIYRRYART